MAEETGISWTNSTFNPWWGCVEVSPGCDHCYARDTSHRYGHEIWGKESPRRFFGDKHWNEPLKWNRKAGESGNPWRVFCASMADVCEEREELEPWRQRLWKLIEATPYLTWLLLTKRPMNFPKMLPAHWITHPLPNVWLLTTVEDNERTWRIPELLKTPAVVHGISYEPALEYVDFRRWLAPDRVNWIITGGESGHKARQFDIEWARDIQLSCSVANVAHFVKQAGDNVAPPFKFTGKGKDPSEWPEWMRVQEFPA